MRFLIDEDIPIKLLEFLKSAGHDAIRVKSGAPDNENAHRAKEEKRIFVTLDKDFTIRPIYPPKEFNIIHIRIHPPFADVIIKAVKKLLEIIPPDNIKGLIILQKSGPVFFQE